MARKCDKCDSPATHKFTRMVEGQAVDFYFCQKHAAEFSPLQQKTSLGQMELTQLLAGFLKQEQGEKAEGEDAAPDDLKCQTCGLVYRQYRKTMLLGCSDCYRVFERQLEQDLRRYHGTVRHCGASPPAKAEPPTDEHRMESLGRRLAIAIEDEDFELAAQLRDQIRKLKAAVDRLPDTTVS